MQDSKKLVARSYEFYHDNRGFYYLWLCEGEEFNMAEVWDIQAFIENDLNGELRPFLIEMGYGATIGEDVQEHLVNSDNRYSTADAILISTYAHKLITEFYVRKYKPTKPTKVFTDIFDALEWIGDQDSN